MFVLSFPCLADIRPDHVTEKRCTASKKEEQGAASCAIKIEEPRPDQKKKSILQYINRNERRLDWELGEVGIQAPFPSSVVQSKACITHRLVRSVPAPEGDWIVHQTG